MTKAGLEKRYKSPSDLSEMKDVLVEACSGLKMVWILYYDDQYEENRMLAPLKVGLLHNGHAAVEMYDKNDRKQPLKLYRIDGMDDVTIVPSQGPAFNRVPSKYKATDERFMEITVSVQS